MPGQVFLQSVQQYLTLRAKDLGAATFDKDDPLAVDFVAAAANLRCCNFGIACESLFAIKVSPGAADVLSPAEHPSLRVDSS